MTSETSPSQHPSSLGLEKIGIVAIAAPWLASLLLVTITVAAAFGIARLKIDDSLSELFRTNTPEFRQYEEIDRRFPSSEYDVLVVVEGKNLLERNALAALSRALVDLQLADGISGVVSMLSARAPLDASGYAAPIVPDPLPEGEAFDAVVKALRENEIVKGKFLSDDGTLALAVIALDREAVAQRGSAAVIKGIQESVNSELANSGLNAKLTGAPVMQLEIRNAYERDQLVYNGLGLVFGPRLGGLPSIPPP